MSNDSEVMRAVLSGAKASDAAYREYYRAFHAELEAATEITLRGFRDEAGRDSYQHLADALAIAGPCSVLDVGCGNGPLLADILDRFPQARVNGVDLSEEEISRARSRLSHENVERLGVADAGEMPFQDAQFDVVTSHMMLMLVPNLDPVLHEVRRVLKPSGRFVFLVPRRGDSETVATKLLQAIPDWIRELHPEYAPVNPGDPRAWDPGQFSSALLDAGFANVQVEDFAVVQAVNADRLWQMIGRRYYVGSLSNETQAHVQAHIRRAVDVGTVDYSEPMRIFEAV